MGESSRDNDLVVKQGEYCFILDESKAIVQVLVGPAKVSMSQTDSTVEWSDELKRFVKVSPKDAIKPCVVAPESYYVMQCNPPLTDINDHPKMGVISMAPELEIGKKVIIPGPCSFALYPGQTAKVIRGHRLSTNQYILCKNYYNKDINKIGTYSIIKGTERSFFIPTTGTEVVPLSNGEYVRDAVTLENLEYCILLDEKGNKEYIHGPEVVFPKPDQVFVTNKANGSYKFRAIELSEISGIYVKVVADYDETVLDHNAEAQDDDGNVTVTPVYKTVHHKVGEELFITGKDQAIYYPRPEHMIITYGESKQTHHAIAIPSGEGRYVLNRLTGEIRMVVGPTMFLPDPRYEVIVKRKLTKKQCELWYPNNDDVLEYNGHGKPTLIAECGNFSGTLKCSDGEFSGGNFLNYCASTQGTGNLSGATKLGIERGNTYTPPRTITIDNRFDGVVSLDVWNGYAVSIVNKEGKRRVVVGPQTVLLGYDEDLEVIDNDVYLKLYGESIKCETGITTADFTKFRLTLALDVTFNMNKKDQWFTMSDYKALICNQLSSSLFKEFKKVTSAEFLQKHADVVAKAVTAWNKENSVISVNADLINIRCEDDEMDSALKRYQKDAFSEVVKYNNLRASYEIMEKTLQIQHQEAEIKSKEEAFINDLAHKTKLDASKKREEIRKIDEAYEKARLETEKEQEILRNANEKIRLQTEKEQWDQKLSFKREEDKLVIDKINAETEAKKKIIDSIGPDLVSALTTASKHEALREISENIAPYALATGGESVSDVVNKLTRGTPLEKVFDKLVDNQ